MEWEDALKEITTKWKLNKDTTIQDITDYYFEITGTYDSPGKMLDYLYKYIIESMYKDGDITEETAKHLYYVLRMEEE